MTKNAPEKGAQLDLRFNDLLANGQGVGRHDGLAVFCFGPLPGERARVRVTAVKRNYAVAEMVELLERSDARAQPFCPVFGECGGCQVQHLSYSAQLEWKRTVVRNALERIGGFEDVRLEPTVAAGEGRAYRNKMSLVVDRSGPGLRLGFYRQRSHDVVPIEGCPIVLEQLDRGIGELNRAAHASATADAFQAVRHVVSRASAATGESVVALTTSKRSEQLRAAAPALTRTLSGVSGILNSYDLASDNAILGRKAETLAGDPAIEETIDGIRYRVSVASFFQVNVAIVARIFEYLRPSVRRGQSILDLYCGAGTFALFFARRDCRVLGVEESGGAVAEARRNALLNGLQDRVRFEIGSAEAVLARAGVASALVEADAVFLDPPRKGSDEGTLARLSDAKVPKIWYLSCDPATLARDLRFLAAKNYRLEAVVPFDMFPQTGHVETLVTLTYQKTCGDG